jgi:hypothetical protein
MDRDELARLTGFPQKQTGSAFRSGFRLQPQKEGKDSNDSMCLSQEFCSVCSRSAARCLASIHGDAEEAETNLHNSGFNFLYRKSHSWSVSAMRQKTLVDEAGCDGLDRESEQEDSLESIEQANSGAVPRSLKLSDARRLAWLGLKLCNSWLYRWFNLCEIGVEEVFYALLMPHFFAEVELVPATASQEAATRHSLEENGYFSPADSPEPSSDRPEPAISWRTPWLYLVLLLLVWLLLF